MKSNNPKRKNILQFLLALAILISINITANYIFFRYDLTEEKRYTLSDFSKNTLSKMEGSVFITIYLEGDQLPIQFKKFRKSIKDILDEFKTYAGSNLQYEFVNPYDEKIDDDQRKALFKRLYNLGIVPVESQEISEGAAKKSLIFPSAVITYTYYNPKTDSIVSKDYGLNLLNNDLHYIQTSPENINNSEQTLEYKFINTIYKISTHKKPQIAFITGHGELPELFVLDMEAALGEYYDVRRGNIGGQYGILDTFKAIIIAKPTLPFPEKDKFVIDQYIMNGGKVLWLVDGVSADMDSVYYYDRSFAMPANTQLIKIDDQLFTYGVRINTDLIEDLSCSKIMLKGISKTGEERMNWYYWFYFPIIISKNNHVINKYIDAIRTEFVSSIDTVGKNPKIKKTILLTTSEYSKLIPVNVPVEISLDEVTKKTNTQTFDKQKIPIAILLEGNFPSLYKGRIVKKYLPKGAKFSEESVSTKMIVISDGDMIKNVVKSTGEIMPLGFDKFSMWTYKGNKQFLLNAVNYLCDDAGLMQIRSREFKLRLLDKKAVQNQKSLWITLNMIVPSLIILLTGIIFNYIRKRKYAR